MNLTGNSIMKKESMNSIIHTRNVAFVNWEEEKIALNLFHAYVIWMKEIIEMKADNYTGRKHLHGEMHAVIFMLQRSNNIQVLASFIIHSASPTPQVPPSNFSPDCL